MCDAPHARYRDRLTLLSTDALLTRAITELGSPRGWWADLAWSRMSGRFKPHAAAFGEFLFEHHAPPQSIGRARPQSSERSGRCAPGPPTRPRGCVAQPRPTSGRRRGRVRWPGADAAVGTPCNGTVSPGSPAYRADHGVAPATRRAARR